MFDVQSANIVPLLMLQRYIWQKRVAVVTQLIADLMMQC